MSTSEIAHPIQRRSTLDSDDVFSLMIGDPYGAQRVFANLEPRLLRYVSGFNPGNNPYEDDMEDVTQEALIQIVTGANKFPARGEGSLGVQFERWSFAVARNRLFTYFDKQAKRREVPLIQFEDESGDEALSRAKSFSESSLVYVDIYPIEQKNEQEYRQRFYSWLDANLPHLQAYIARRRFEGKQNKDILQETEVSRETLMKEAQRARATIEQKLLRPAGLLPLMSFRNDTKRGFKKRSLHSAATSGRIDYIQIMDIYYTTPDSIERYRNSIKQAQAHDSSPGRQKK